MKKIVPFLILFIVANQAIPHGIDGCSVGSVLNGVNQSGTSNYLGIQSIYFNNNSPVQDFWGKMYSNSSTGNSLNLSGRYYFRHKIGLSGTINYNWLKEVTYVDKNTTSGIGDSRVLIELPIYKKITSDKNVFFSLSAGLEVPTGKMSDNLTLRAFSTGSGSWDFPIQFQFFTNKNHKGLNINFAYQVNSFNPNNYKFGNQLSFSASTFKSWQMGSSTISLSSGIQLLHFANDHSKFNTIKYEINNQRSFGLFKLNASFRYLNSLFQLGISKNIYYQGNNTYGEKLLLINASIIKTLKHC
ncbi:MAG: hypothetical protein ACPGLV_12695 [Bacteroidia bacterium]